MHNPSKVNGKLLTYKHPVIMVIIIISHLEKMLTMLFLVDQSRTSIMDRGGFDEILANSLEVEILVM